MSLDALSTMGCVKVFFFKKGGGITFMLFSPCQSSFATERWLGLRLGLRLGTNAHAVQMLTQFAYSHVSAGETSSTSIVLQQTSSLNTDFRGFLLELLRENQMLKQKEFVLSLEHLNCVSICS